jgi:hypothetical protein
MPLFGFMYHMMIFLEQCEGFLLTPPPTPTQKKKKKKKKRKKERSRFHEY